ncbi:MAG TPA: Maf family protein [Methylomirabilota bacterium]
MVILASASPRRRELLGRLLPRFEVVPGHVDERLEGPVGPGPVADIALRKARAVAAGRGAGIVLGADTVVVIDARALGKPGDAGQAADMLRRLRGRVHEVITGVAVVDASTSQARTVAVVSQVFMRDYTDAQIDAYVASGEPQGKAGAYAVQERGGALVAGWIGSYSNIVGLPLEATGKLLVEFGASLTAWKNPPA